MTTATLKPATTIDQSGLRYEKKETGTPFRNAMRGYGSTMSCFRCGKHKTPDELATKKLLGKNHRVCKEKCK